jgi:hypothetical protein
MMSSRGIKILKTLLIVNLMAIVLIFLFFNSELLYAFEIGFLSSALVVGASLFSYRRMVENRVEEKIVTLDDSKDVIDKLEDPYDLYSEEIQEGDKTLQELVKDERKKLKSNRRSLFEMLKDTKAALSVYRLGAYVILVLGFLYLNRHGLLHIPTYIIALGLAPLIIVTILLREKERQTEDTIQ